eukprot:CAMPEP_0117623220 /NCGR_PEP_ID=MMETSP0784-20121206/88537_1 /TAXON_ID=39447 /ORGANISM="" /LENGTH=352 /DNA_ID=CAMNT_0005427169 /DNA_START=78 /DNA_END=1133 /DNA_ORIENTATION=+
MFRLSALLLASLSLVSFGLQVQVSPPLGMSPHDGVVYTNASSEPYLQVLMNSAAVGGSITELERQAILNKHNSLRSAVSVPCTAADMSELTWDQDLASAAETWASQCNWRHDPGNAANGWGENLAMSWSSVGNAFDAAMLEGFVDQWYAEANDVEWSSDFATLEPKEYADPENMCTSYNSGSGKCMIGHYTQVVWAASKKIGCGVARCDTGLVSNRGGVFMVCKYSPAGNLAAGTGISAPWTPGTPCAACGGGCTLGSLCAAGSSAVICKDAITAMTFNGITFRDCASLISYGDKFISGLWCRDFEPTYPICQLSCGQCSVQEGVGVDFCPSGDDSSKEKEEDEDNDKKKKK